MNIVEERDVLFREYAKQSLYQVTSLLKEKTQQLHGGKLARIAVYNEHREIYSKALLEKMQGILDANKTLPGNEVTALRGRLDTTYKEYMNEFLTESYI